MGNTSNLACNPHPQLLNGQISSFFPDSILQLSSSLHSISWLMGTFLTNWWWTIHMRRLKKHTDKSVEKKAYYKLFTFYKSATKMTKGNFTPLSFHVNEGLCRCVHLFFVKLLKNLLNQEIHQSNWKETGLPCSLKEQSSTLDLRTIVQHPSSPWRYGKSNAQ